MGPVLGFWKGLRKKQARTGEWKRRCSTHWRNWSKGRLAIRTTAFEEARRT